MGKFTAALRMLSTLGLLFLTTLNVFAQTGTDITITYYDAQGTVGKHFRIDVEAPGLNFADRYLYGQVRCPAGEIGHTMIDSEAELPTVRVLIDPQTKPVSDCWAAVSSVSRSLGWRDAYHVTSPKVIQITTDMLIESYQKIVLPGGLLNAKIKSNPSFNWEMYQLYVVVRNHEGWVGSVIFDSSETLSSVDIPIDHTARLGQGYWLVLCAVHRTQGWDDVYYARTTSDISISENAVGPNGGVVTHPSGLSVTIPPHALQDAIPVTIERLEETDVLVLLPSDTTFLGGFSLDLSGAILDAPVSLVLPVPTQTPMDAHLLVVQMINERMVLVDSLVIHDDELLTGSLPQFVGIMSEGSFLFLSLNAQIPLITFDLINEEGDPIQGAEVRLIPALSDQTVVTANLAKFLDINFTFSSITNTNGSLILPGASTGLDMITTVLMPPLRSENVREVEIGVAVFRAPEFPFPPDSFFPGSITSILDQIITDKSRERFQVKGPKPSRCPRGITVEPDKLPDSNDPFLVGETEQLRVKGIHDGADLTRSTEFSLNFKSLLTLFKDILSGSCLHITLYGPKDRDIADVPNQEGAVEAKSKGQTTITVSVFQWHPLKAYSKSQILVPVTVEDCLQDIYCFCPPGKKCTEVIWEINLAYADWAEASSFVVNDQELIPLDKNGNPWSKAANGKYLWDQNGQFDRGIFAPWELHIPISDANADGRITFQVMGLNSDTGSCYTRITSPYEAKAGVFRRQSDGNSHQTSLKITP